MNSAKLLFASLATLLAAIAGLYLAGYLALLFLKLDPAHLAWHTYRDYVRALDLAQVKPYAGRVRAAGWIGFGACSPRASSISMRRSSASPGVAPSAFKAPQVAT